MLEREEAAASRHKARGTSHFAPRRRRKKLRGTHARAALISTVQSGGERPPRCVRPTLAGGKPPATAADEALEAPFGAPLSRAHQALGRASYCSEGVSGISIMRAHSDSGTGFSLQVPNTSWA